MHGFLLAALHAGRGYPRSEIARRARKPKADLVVMGTVARMGIAGFLVGNTKEADLERIDCLVLVLKPASLVTPAMERG